MSIKCTRHVLECLGSGYFVIPFGFTINGTSDPDGRSESLSACARSEAGEFLATIHSSIGKPYACLYAHAAVSNTADDVDMYCTVDWSTVASAGTFVVRTMTGSTQTDPTDNLLVGGFLLVQLNSRLP